MFNNVKELTDVLVKWRITPNQFYLCWLLYWDHRDLKGGKRRAPDDETAIVNLYRYAEKVRTWRNHEFKDLLEKDLIEQSYGKEGDRILDRYQVTDKFIEEVIVTKDRAKEFYEAYPTWVRNFSNPARGDINLSAVENLEAFYDKYRYMVQTQKEHQHVMEILEWAKSENLIKYNVNKFVGSRMWEHFEELMEKENTGDDEYGTTTAY